MEIKRGDIFWIAPEDGGGSVSHPHLVLQEDVFNRSRIHSVIVCALTSNLCRSREPGNVLLDEGEGGLDKQSVIVVSQLSSIEKRRLGPRIGSLSNARVDQAVAGLRLQQTSYFRQGS